MIGVTVMMMIAPHRGIDDDNDDILIIIIQMTMLMISSLTDDKGYDDISNSPCDIIATYHDDCVFVWNPTCTPSRMFQIKCVSI